MQLSSITLVSALFVVLAGCANSHVTQGGGFAGTSKTITLTTPPHSLPVGCDKLSDRKVVSSVATKPRHGYKMVQNGVQCFDDGLIVQDVVANVENPGCDFNQPDPRFCPASMFPQAGQIYEDLGTAVTTSAVPQTVRVIEQVVVGRRVTVSPTFTEVEVPGRTFRFFESVSDSGTSGITADTGGVPDNNGGTTGDTNDTSDAGSTGEGKDVRESPGGFGGIGGQDAPTATIGG